MPRLRCRRVVLLWAAHVGVAHVRNEPSFVADRPVWIHFVHPALRGGQNLFQARGVPVDQEDAALCGVLPHFLVSFFLVGCGRGVGLRPDGPPWAVVFHVHSFYCHRAQVVQQLWVHESVQPRV